MISVQADDYSRTDGQSLHVAKIPGDFDQIPRMKGTLHGEKDAGQEVLRDVAERNTEDQAEQPRAADHGQCQASQTANLENDVQADQKDEDAKRSRHYLAEQRRSHLMTQQRAGQGRGKSCNPEREEQRDDPEADQVATIRQALAKGPRARPARE